MRKITTIPPMIVKTFKFSKIYDMQEAYRQIEPETKQTVEMAFSGNKQVIDNILFKNRLIEQNDQSHEKIKTTLILPGGGQRGVVIAGVGIALERLGIVKAFDNVLAVSTGAPVGYYTLAGEIVRGATIYYEDNVKNNLVNFLRFWKVMDISGLEKVFRKDKPVKTENFRKSRPNFLVGVTNWKTGEGKFFDAKSFEDPLDCVIASISVPYLGGGKSVILEGEKFVDGVPGNPLPISYAIEELKSTDILVAMTSPLTPRPQSRMTSIFNRKFINRFGPGIWKALVSYERRYNTELKYLTGEKPVPQGVRIATIYPKKMPITTFTMDSHLLRSGAQAATAFTEDLFRGMSLQTGFVSSKNL